MRAYAFWMYGMWGPVTDPGSCQMSQRIANETGADICGSPYRDYDVNVIVEFILALQPSVPVIVGGTSLGANNAPVVASYVHARNPKRIIHGMWGFQASMYGAKQPIPPNVLFAHLTSSANPIPLPGLGAYRWTKAPGNTVTDYYNPTVNDPHPGDGNVVVQNSYIAEMKRVIETAGATI